MTLTAAGTTEPKGIEIEHEPDTTRGGLTSVDGNGIASSTAAAGADSRASGGPVVFSAMAADRRRRVRT